jgi:RND family efflux transporter MFP subunit
MRQSRPGQPLVAAILGAALLAACDQEQGQQQAAPPPAPVTVATPLQKDIRDWDEFTGRLEASNLVELRARVSGYLTAVHFKDGQDVKTGDLLFTVDKRPFERAVEQAEAELSRARSTLDFTKADLERAKPLVERGTVSVQSFQDRQRAEGEAEAAVQGAEARLKAAQLDLEFTEVRAPLDGRISNRRVDVGNYVTGGSGATVLTNIVSLDPIYFVFDASEADYLDYARMLTKTSGDRQMESPVELMLMDEKDWSHKGVMNFVDNRLDPNSGTIRGRAVFENDDGFLTPGVFGRLRVADPERYTATLVPDEALVSDQGRKLLMSVDAEGKVVAKPVETGPLYEGLRVIRSGIAPTDRIVISGVQRARPGQTVKPEDGKIEPRPDAPPGQSADISGN